MSSVYWDFYNTLYFILSYFFFKIISSCIQMLKKCFDKKKDNFEKKYNCNLTGQKLLVSFP